MSMRAPSKRKMAWLRLPTSQDGNIIIHWRQRVLMDTNGRMIAHPGGLVCDGKGITKDSHAMTST
eukprot:scaffold342559_cov26-Prasinocladus_malaysianus.AAC.1